jgi:simple sugar transport system permease protein
MIGVLVIQSLTTSILASGMPPQHNLVVKAVVVLFVLLQPRSARQAVFSRA